MPPRNAVSNPFSASTVITTQHLQPDQIIPPKHHVAGEFVGVRVEKDQSLKIRLFCQISTGGVSSSDYTLPKEGGTAKYILVLVCQPPVDMLDSAARVQSIAEEKTKAVDLTGRNVLVDVTNLAVHQVTTEVGGSIKVLLVGKGKRTFRLSSGQIVHLMSPSEVPSRGGTPSWMALSQESVDNDLPDLPPVPAKGTPLYQPISKHPIPALSQIPKAHISAQAGKSRQSLNMAKRSRSPEKPVTGATKRVRISSGPPIEHIQRNEEPVDDVEDIDEGRTRRLQSPPPRSSPDERQNNAPIRQTKSLGDEAILPTGVDMDLQMSQDSSVQSSQDVVQTVARPAVGFVTRREAVQKSAVVTEPEAIYAALTPSRHTPDARPLHPSPDVLMSPRGVVSAETPLTDAPFDHNPLTAKATAPAHSSAPEEIAYKDQPEAREASPVLARADFPVVSPASKRRRVELAIMQQKRKEAEAKALKERETREAAEATRRQQEADDEAAVRLPLRTAQVHYTLLSDLRANTTMSFMGVFVTGQPPNRGKDWTMTIVIADPTTHINGLASDDVAVTIFRQTKEALPTARRGDVFLIRDAKVSVWSDKLKGQLYSNAPGTWALLNGTGKISYDDNPLATGSTISNLEIERMEALSRWWETQEGGADPLDTNAVTGSGVSNTVTSVDTCQKDAVLKQIRGGNYYNITVKVLHAVRNDRMPHYELYVSDGTVSPCQVRNFHGISYPPMPASAIFTIAIFDEQPAAVDAMLKAGNVLQIKNVRVTDRQGLEMKWSEKVSGEQLGQGWKPRQCQLIPPDDDRVRVINTRINALKRGVEPRLDQAKQERSVSVPADPFLDATEPVAGQTAARSKVPVSRHLCTKHVSQDFSTIEDVLANGTLPNKYCVRARVKSLHSANPRPGPASYIQYFCTKCSRSFTSAYCQSCNDKQLSRAELRYRLVAQLESPNTDAVMPVIIADSDAEAIFDALPPIRQSGNPNDYRKMQTRFKELNAKVEVLLLGPKMDGERTRPVIEWSLESYEARKRGREQGVVVIRAFGMEAKRP